MSNFLAQGFMVGLAYVAPIGMQNLYVINSAMSNKRIRAYQVALIVILFDISLALASFFGMGLLMDRFQLLKTAIFLIGSLAVIYIGIMLIKSKPEANRKVDINKSLFQITTACFAVTWLNPQALIDGSLLLGGFRASLTPQASNLFIIGVCIASLTWFGGLTTVVSIFKNNINDQVIRWINIICGCIIMYFGVKLGLNFINGIF